MSEDRRSEPDARMLRQMGRELSDDPLPVLPWEQIEARLFSRLEEASPEGAATVDGPGLSVEVLADRPSVVPAADRPSAIPASVPERESLVAREPEPARPARGRASTGRWARGLAAAGALAAGIGALYFVSSSDPRAPMVAVAEPIDASQVPRAPGMAAGVLDARSLYADDVVEAALGPLAFGASDTASSDKLDAMAWTLAAGSRAVVREPASAAVHVVELESGSIHVEATGPKRFVVRAGQTEVASALGGAIFTVTRSSRGIVVHVERGSVLVGERGVAGERGKSGEGRVLDGPVRASVSLDGARTVELIPNEVAESMQAPPARPTADAPLEAPEPNAPSSVAEQEAIKPRPHQAAQRPAEPAPEPPPSPAGAGPISEASIRASVQRCFSDVQAKKAPNEGVSVSVSSTLRVVVRADGSVQGVTFNPPLGSDLQGCAVFLFRENLGPGARALSIPVAASAGPAARP